MRNKWGIVGRIQFQPSRKKKFAAIVAALGYRSSRQLVNPINPTTASVGKDLEFFDSGGRQHGVFVDSPALPHYRGDWVVSSFRTGICGNCRLNGFSPPF